MKNRTTR